ncbi:hypothetical protein [Rubrivivax gelatinosus]|uniref:Beta-lactamase family protein n=1 Tax=Rubrivivax gelatinosus TaxID=28068 RepID=A0A4R2MBJ1_RUBGE|nr:hypothetical protein [Rubrivivax gelatinosus]MBK1690344.1 hypothetical protein [Rubrivivax gelatinosus]TCP04092.1 hypothetical protein EV684_103341 [Rubrivivax gelatinosus]
MDRATCPTFLRRLVPALLVTLAGCGGGGGGGGFSDAPTLAERIAAARSVAETAADCEQIRPFYWEVGDASGPLASGSFAGLLLTIDADTTLPIASASKWIYGSYVVQSKAGVLSDDDIRFLGFRSGYTNFRACGSDTTVGNCLDVEGRDGGTNGDYVAENDGFFVYSGGHMQKHASMNPALADLGPSALATEMRRVLGTGITMSYSGPQLAGGVETSATDYALFLRRILDGTLSYERAALGTHPVCVDPASCSTAKFTPSPEGEQWHYSIGHWVEDDPDVGDGAFSSPGAFGFYPWIDASKTWYGVISRLSLLDSDPDTSVAVDSVQCGRAIRAAWLNPASQ